MTALYQSIQKARKEKKNFIGISLDLKAAYVSVYIDGMISKCAQMGITGRILRWIHNFLMNRSIKILWRGRMSTLRDLNRGVPQGAVLSPILFTIFLSDFHETLVPKVHSLIYADDIFIYSICDSYEAGCRALQDALRNINRWCNYWKLDISAEKCSAIDLSRRRITDDFDFYVNNRCIQWVDDIKFLGFFFSRKGGFKTHVDYLRKKAFKRLSILKMIASRRYGARSYHLLQLARSTICSMVDHGATILCGVKTSLLEKLEVINTSALRVTLGFPRWTPNLVLRKHADAIHFKLRLKNRSFQFWVKHVVLGDWSPLKSLLDITGDGVGAASVLPAEFGDILEDIGYRLEHFIPFYFPSHSHSDRVQIVDSGLPFQDTNLSDRVINMLLSDYLQAQEGPIDIIATDASKQLEKTSIAVRWVNLAIWSTQ